MVVIDETYLEHYGTPRHSGRYPWGSHGWGKGEETLDSSPRSPTFLDNVKGLRKAGIKDTDIAKGWGISSTQLRARITIANAEKKQSEITQITALRDKGMGTTAIGERLGIPESVVRARLAPAAADRAKVLTKTSDMLKRAVEEKKFVQVGAGIDAQLGISQQKLEAAIAVLKEEGYVVHNVPVRQLGTGMDTNTKVLAAPGTTWGEVRKNSHLIQPPTEFTDDGGRAYTKIHDPISIHPNRVKVRYGNEGGGETDGVIYVRPGVEDISLGESRYAQVRVQVGDAHYLKGMAMYKDDLPKGVDLVFNTNKKATGNKLDAMKPISENTPELPFGAIVRQILADEHTPNERVTSAMNIVNPEGKWGKWSKSISSQVLSKQPPSLAKEQLDKTYAESLRDFEEIDALTNPTVKKTLLKKFASGVDSAGVHLKAAAMPRQGWHAILPLDSIPPNQIYAPNFRPGERVVLIRYPHGGTFEIPELVVNNRHPEGRSLLGDAADAVGIHHSVAQRLSGADFDGDTVLVIPNVGRKKIKHSPPLEGLKNFDPISSYPPYDGMKTIDGGTWNEKDKKVDYTKPATDYKQTLMGEVSNLITDMTIQAAPHEHIARAVRHSMVVIDAEKHALNYKESYQRNGISALKKEYQGKARGGAYTLISRAGGEVRLPERKPRGAREGGPINKETGALEFVPSNKTRFDKQTGTRVIKEKKYKRLSLTSDAHTLSSGTPIEKIYADHSNRLKALANKARLESLRTPNLEYSKTAKVGYAKEVQSLNAKLALSKRNAPLERQAQIMAGANVKAKRLANPGMDRDTVQKLEFAEIEIMRNRLGAHKKDKQIKITQEEWNAIQAGAISNHKLEQILNNTDIETIRKYATPRRRRLMSTSDTSLAKRLLSAGASRLEVADRLGVSLSTLDRSVKGEEG